MHTKSNQQEIKLSSPPNVLTIAGSDSSGGAGIQADIKTFSALGVYSASVITNITAQNTCGIDSIFTLPSEQVHAQLKSVFEDISIDAVKVGMLYNTEIIQLMSNILQKYQPEHIVIDPVLISTSGNTLLDDAAIESLSEKLFPLASIITPNLPEASRLLNLKSDIKANDDIKAAAQNLDRYKSKAVLIKGGHLEGDHCIDTLWDGVKITQFTNLKVNTKNTHGTGCTLSSAITAYLALGLELEEAVLHASHYLHGAIQHADALNVGLGHGPVNHFYKNP